MTDFDLAFNFTLSAEGGDKETNDPSDPGGLTKWGLAQRYLPSDIDLEKMTYDQAKSYYEHQYWLKYGCDKLAWPLNCVHFDACVNPGSHHASHFFNACANQPENYLALREAWYRQNVAAHPAKHIYLQGWLNRVKNLRAYIHAHKPEVA